MWKFILFNGMVDVMQSIDTCKKKYENELIMNNE